MGRLLCKWLFVCNGVRHQRFRHLNSARCAAALDDLKSSSENPEICWDHSGPSVTNFEGHVQTHLQLGGPTHLQD